MIHPAACFATLRSILIRDFIGLSVLASAFGLCLSFQGVAAIASSPMAGIHLLLLSSQLVRGGVAVMV